MAKYNTKLEAAQAWVREFNEIPQSFILKAFEGGGSFIFDQVEVLAEPYKECYDCGAWTDFDDETCPECGSTDFGNTYEIPMWGTMWTFGESLDEEWARNNASILAECGFHVFDSDELGVFIGIDGAGYDFYEAHWVPLYEARGLQWHK